MTWNCLYIIRLRGALQSRLQLSSSRPRLLRHSFRDIQVGWCSKVTFLDFIHRKKYNNDDNKVLFLAVSDDNKWIKVQWDWDSREDRRHLILLWTIQTNLGNHSDVMFGSDFSSQSVAAEDHVGFDLCVLASSDHTVITYGTNLPPL